MNEVKLISRCLKRDKKAWDIFVDKYSKLIYWSIRKRAAASSFELSQDDIDSIFQEVFLSVLENKRLLQLKEEKAITSWMAVISFNKTVDFIRVKIRQGQRLVPDEMIPAASDCRQDSSYKELMAVVKSALATLSPRKRMVLALNLLNNRTHQEIAEMMSISINTVSTIISRAKLELKQELTRQGIKNYERK
ncbi:MAG: sigma-70 family RNA polymerase sigma factor [Candidatus Omnitrophica bacterium]|nr:sigma-70 family RNA polymerase sigma factor [Candidatus Omnitrophota bacterium]